MAGRRTSAPTKGRQGSKKGSGKAPRKKPALDKRDEFIRLYLIHKNASQAYREAGYKATTSVRQNAHDLLTSPYVRDRLADARENVLARLDVKVDQVFDRFKAIAFGDPAALTEYIIGACRYCHSMDHRYHWKTHREYADAMEAYMQLPEAARIYKIAPDDEGGYGYKASAPPHPDCPECDGRGIPSVQFKDTRLMTPDERKLFAGVKVTQHGIEFKLNDQMGALKELAEHIQFYKERDETNANAVARLITDLRARGTIQRMPLRKDPPEGEQT